MAAPTVISTLDSGVLDSTVTTTSLNVPTSQAGDVFIVYVFTNASGIVGDTPIPDHATNLNHSYTNVSDADNGLSIYALTDPTGATNWNIQCPLLNGPVGAWVAGYIQVRGGVARVNDNAIIGGVGNPATIGFTTTTAHSGVLALINDAAGIDKASSIWASTDGYDPNTGGTVYLRTGVTGFFGFYAAYFPDIGPASTYTYSMSGGSYVYAMLTYEVEEAPIGSAGVATAWFTA
jgi:hypothetical protein